MVISTGQARYTFDGTLAAITDADHEAGNSSAFFNNQFLMDGTNQTIFVTNAGDPTSVLSENKINADSSSDNTIRVINFKDRLYPFGDRDSVETWYNTAEGNPPIDRIQNGTMTVGLSAPNAVTKTNNFFYWAGTDRDWETKG